MTLWHVIKDLFRKYFVAGLLVLLPLMGTLWILKVLIFAIEDFFYGFVPAPLLPERFIGMRIPGVGLILTIVIIIGVGILTRLVLARQFIRLGERVFNHIPIGRGVYHGIKQLMQLIVGQSESRFSRVVVVEFPQPGSYVYGFVTGEVGIAALPTPGRLLCVFLPTTPNPTSGYLLLVPQDRSWPAGISVDEAMKIIISGGLATRPSTF